MSEPVESPPGFPSRVHIWVTGRVQGVGFRAFCLQAASARGLAGWVRNNGDDGVEIVAEGTHRALEVFISMVKQGPRAGKVEDTRVEWEHPNGESTRFIIRSSR
jgi:acylphosphatase